MSFDWTQPIGGVVYHEGLTVPDDLTRRLKDAGWSVETWTDPPGSVHSPHDHPYSHRVLCRSGWIEFTVEGETHRLKSDDTLDLPARVTHEATSCPDQSTEYWLLRPSE